MDRFLRSSVSTHLCILLFSLMYMIAALHMNMPIVNGVLTESFFPLLISSLAIVVSAHLVLQSLSVDDNFVVSRKTVIIMLGTFLFPVLFGVIGFTFSVPLYIFFLEIIFDDTVGNIKKKIIASAIISLFVFILYQIIFQIRFPELWS